MKTDTLKQLFHLICTATLLGTFLVFVGCTLAEDVGTQAAEAELANCILPAVESKIDDYEESHDEK